MAQRILVVDDDRKLVRVLQSYLEQSGLAVLTAYDGAAATHLIQSERPDLVVLDLMLPQRDGWEIAKWIRGSKALASIPILMLTARIEDADKLHGFELGADDYVTKPFSPGEVVARILAILRRAQGQLTASHIITCGGLRMDTQQFTITLNAQPLDLTKTEYALLQVMMRQPNRTFTRAELIELALGYAYEGMERTLDSHIKNLRKKIESNPAEPQYIETVFGAGYRLREGATEL
ncbi:MAG: response regulator transcription factor [Anaerolineae bacterium]|nr:response regulator transcription factor [Anaerolineae bacterium]